MKFCMRCMFQYENKYNLCPKCGFPETTQPSNPRCIPPGSILADRYIAGMPTAIESMLIRYIGWDALNEKRISIYEYMPEQYASRGISESRITPTKSKPFYRFLEVLNEKAKQLSELSLPENISSVGDYFEANGTLYVITDYYTGKSFDEYLNTKGNLNKAETEKMFVSLMESVDKLHDEHYVIGGFSPCDIIVTDNNTLVLDSYIKNIFFNLYDETSKAEHSADSDYYPYERLRAYCGEELSPACDVYSAAMIYYKMLGGKVPDCRERIALYQRSGKDTVGTKGITIDTNTENALINALCIEQSERTGDMETLIKDLSGEREVIRYNKLKKKKTPLAVKIAAPTAAIAAAGICIAVFAGGNTNKELLKHRQTIVPDVINQTVASAESELERSELLLEIEGKQIDDDTAEDIVVRQSIDAETVVDTNTTVGVTVTSHSSLISMPNLLGMDIDDCGDLLSGLGIKYSVSREYSSSVAKNCVISQNVVPYEKIRSGDSVQLVVSDGLDPGKNYDKTPFQIEDLTNVPVDRIVERHDNDKNYDWRVNYNTSGTNDNAYDPSGYSYEPSPAVADNPYQLQVVDRVYDAFKPEGTIVSQKPLVGTTISPTDTIQVTVTTRVDELVVPNVTLISKEDAESTLKKYGLSISCTEKESETVKEDFVISQSPDAGKIVEIGSTIDLTVSSGKPKVAVPSLIGLQRKEALKLLNKTRLIAKFTYKTDTSVPEDQVLLQSEEADSMVKAGSIILITLSTSKPIKEIPSVLGQGAYEARQTLAGDGFKVDSFNADKQSESSELKVISQSPEAGLCCHEGASIFIVLGDSSANMWGADGFSLSEEEVSMTVGDEFTLKIFIPHPGVDFAFTPDPGTSSVINYKGFDTSSYTDHYEITIVALARGTETIRFDFGDGTKECMITVR